MTTDEVRVGDQMSDAPLSQGDEKMVEQAVAQKPMPLSDLIQNILLGAENISDLHIEQDQPVMLRRGSYDWYPAKYEGELIIPTDAQVVGFIHGIHGGDEQQPPAKNLTDEQKPVWLTKLAKYGSLQPAINMSREVSSDPVEYESCRVRCLIERQGMGESIGMVMRRIGEVPQSLQELGVPFQVENVMENARHGLVIVTGPTGSGKSTTMAALIDQINTHRTANIITIEDPVEFVHERKKSIINQREVGIDVKSYADGVLDALRFVPDVIMIGEIRDAATMRQALRFSESGHLVLTSLHAPNWSSAIRKVIALLSENPGDLQSLPHVLVAVIAQALIRPADGKGKNHLAAEYVDCTEKAVVDAVAATVLPQGENQSKGLSALERAIAAGSGRGQWNTTMLEAVKRLIADKKIDARSALAAVSNSEDKAELSKLIASSN